MRARAASIKSSGATSQPSRQPTIEKYLEKLFTTIASGAYSSALATGPTNDRPW